MAECIGFCVMNKPVVSVIVFMSKLTILLESMHTMSSYLSMCFYDIFVDLLDRYDWLPDGLAEKKSINQQTFLLHSKSPPKQKRNHSKDGKLKDFLVESSPCWRFALRYTLLTWNNPEKHSFQLLVFLCD